MLDTLQTDALQVELLAHEVVACLKDTEPGHCARVDFLNRSVSVSVCQYIMHQQLAHGVVFHILASHEAQTKSNVIFITTDKAIEIRNRKQERLCLFVPSDLVDAAYSSIANSFALIDGRELHSLVLKHVLAQLSPELSSAVRTVFAGVLDSLRIAVTHLY